MKRAESYTGPERRKERRGFPGGNLLDAIFGLLRWIGSHVRGFYTALGLFLVIGLGVIIAALLLFAGVAALVAQGVTQRFDEAVLLWLNARATPELDLAALEITALGSGVVIYMTVFIASAFLWATRHRYSVLLLWVAVLGGVILNLELKALFDRPRPELFPWRTQQVGHSSFPSGHAMMAVVVYATLAYLVARLEATRALRRLTLGLTAVVIVLIGLTRLYLGVHYPSDVVAGFIIGFAWATFCALGIEAVRYFRTRKPEVDRAEHDLERGTAPIRDAVQAHPSEPRPGEA